MEPTTPPVSQAPAPSSGGGASTWLNLLALAGVLFLFVVSLEVMGDGIKSLGGTFDLRGMLEKATNTPILALITGILVTSLVQSSSTTTSLVVTLVAAGTLSIENAVPVIMGANIGTSITTTLITGAMYSGDSTSYRRAFAA
ncbi:MAG: Na/Pi symporter, partial [Bacteroidota bacterium]